MTDSAVSEQSEMSTRRAPGMACSVMPGARLKKPEGEPVEQNTRPNKMH